MILVDRDILAARQRGEIVITPWDPKSLGTNSYDVHLGPKLLTYRDEELDCRRKPTVDEHVIPDVGALLLPGIIYLASTVEYTESHRHVPMLNGKSSLGRLGLMIHVTAGFGDVGFCNHWTMELAVIQPLRVYAGMPIGQLYWEMASDIPLINYAAKQSAKYRVVSADPGASEMAKNFHKP